MKSQLTAAGRKCCRSDKVSLDNDIGQYYTICNKGGLMHKAMTRQELIDATGVEWYVIEYLYRKQRLPTVRDSQGRGYPRLYHPDAVEIVKAHISRNDVAI